MTTALHKPFIESSIHIDRSPEAMWDYLADVSHDTQWRDGVQGAAWVSDPPYEVGSSGLHLVDGIGDWPWTVIAWEPPRVMAWDVTGGRFKGAQGAYRVDPDGDGSLFALEINPPSSFIAKLMMRFLKGRIERANAVDLAKLKAIMEA